MILLLLGPRPFLTFALPYLVELIWIYINLYELDLADQIASTSYSCWSLVTGELLRVKEGLVAVESKLGWLLSGLTEPCMLTERFYSNLVIDNLLYLLRLRRMLKLFRKVESSGVPTDEDGASADYNFLQGLKFDGQLYQADLLWNHDKQELPDHFQLC